MKYTASEISEHRRLVVEALEWLVMHPGEEPLYPQGRGELCTLDENGKPIGFCCLGVMSQVAVDNGLKIEVVDLDLNNRRTYDGNGHLIPQAVAEWVGVPHMDAPAPGNIVVPTPDGMYDYIKDITLSSLNDGDGYTHAQIAEILRTEWNLGDRR